MSYPVFKVEVDPPADDYPGKIRLSFLVPHMWFGIWQPLSALMPRGRNHWEREAARRDAIERFLDMIRREIESAWPEKLEDENAKI